MVYVLRDERGFYLDIDLEDGCGGLFVAEVELAGMYDSITDALNDVLQLGRLQGDGCSGPEELTIEAVSFDIERVQ